MQMAIDEHHQHKDVYQHSLTVLRQAIALEDDGPDLVLRWAALLHDIGKPATRRHEANGGVSFHHHEVVGAKMVRKRLRALKYSKQMVEDISQLVYLHLRFHGYGDGKWTDSAVRRYVTDAARCCHGCTNWSAPTARPATSGGPRGCSPATTGSRRGSPSWPPRRIWRGCVPTWTATRSWNCSASRGPPSRRGMAVLEGAAPRARPVGHRRGHRGTVGVVAISGNA